MVRIAGDLILVTKSPAAVTEVWIRPDGLRPHGGGLIVDDPDRVPVVGGFLEVDCVPGPAVITLVSHGVASRAVPIVVPDEETATLAECLDQIHVYDPPVVGRAQQFAREAGEHADRAEAGADRVGSAEQVGAWVGEAEVLWDDTVQAADRAETQAGVATEQASLARQHREGAEGAESSAHGAAGAAAASTTALIRDEMDAKVTEAGQSAQSAGESAAASATSAGESATSAQEAGQSAQAAGQHLQDTRDLKSGIDAWWLDDLLPTVDAVAADRAATQDDRRQTGEDRAATGGHLTEVTRLHGEAEQARDDAQEAAANAQTGAPPEGWSRSDLDADVREDLSRARSALQDVPDATGDARGMIRLSGDLGGTATSPTVPALTDKVDASQVAAPGTAPVDAPGMVPRVSPGGALVVNEAPVGDLDAVSKHHLDERVSTRSPVGHRHDVEQIDGLDPAIRALITEASSTHLWDGEGTWQAPWWAGPNDSVINLSSGEIHSVVEGEGE